MHTLVRSAFVWDRYGTCSSRWNDAIECWRNLEAVALQAEDRSAKSTRASVVLVFFATGTSAIKESRITEEGLSAP